MVTKTLTETLREIIDTVDKGGPGTAEAQAQVLRDLGIVANCHLNDIAETDMGTRKAVEWYAGQFLDIVDSKSWFAMNSFLNCRDKFAPAGGP